MLHFCQIKFVRQTSDPSKIIPLVDFQISTCPPIFIAIQCFDKEGKGVIAIKAAFI